jgi:hypothetical protein
MRKNNKYNIDSSNRLVISKKSGKIIPKTRFSTDKNNDLICRINEPLSWRRKYDLPSKIKFEGKWKLDPAHDLLLNLTEKAGFKQGYFLLNGQLISCEADMFVFEIKSVDVNGQSHIQILKLSGLWKTDDKGRICFSVNKKGSPDTLTFQGDWQINKNQQLTYTYEKTDLKTKEKKTFSVTFLGFWEISDRNKLTYILSRSLDSRFDFRVQLETPNLQPKKGTIKYRLGTGVRQRSLKGPKIICLYGAWRFSRKLGIVFDMEYEKGKVRSQDFGAELDFVRNNKIVFDLKDSQGDKLGISVVYSHQFFKQQDAQFFLKLKKMREDSVIEAGINIPF